MCKEQKEDLHGLTVLREDEDEVGEREAGAESYRASMATTHRN